MSIQVLSHDLILEKVKFAELEGQELSEKVLHMLLVLAREKLHEVAQNGRLLLTELGKKALSEDVGKDLGKV